MSSLNTIRFDVLRLLGYTGATNEMFFDYLGDTLVSATQDQLNDRMVSGLDGEVAGTVKQLNDLWFTYLGDLGFTGSLNEREIAYWEDVANGFAHVEFTTEFDFEFN